MLVAQISMGNLKFLPKAYYVFILSCRPTLLLVDQLELVGWTVLFFSVKTILFRALNYNPFVKRMTANSEELVDLLGWRCSHKEEAITWLKLTNPGALT